MKKLFTLFALFAVMGFTAMAGTWSTDKDYYIDPTACTWLLSDGASIQIWDGANDISAQKMTNGYLTFHLTNPGTDGVIYIKRLSPSGEKWNEYAASAPENDADNLFIVNSDFNGGEWSVYVPQTISGTWSTDKDYFLATSACTWLENDGAVIRIWDGAQDVDTEQVETGVLKFRLSNGGDNGYITIRRYNPDLATVWNDLGVAATSDDAQNLITVNSNFNGYTWGEYTAVVNPDPDPDPTPDPDPDPDPVVTTPDVLYIVGNITNGSSETGAWDPAAAIALTKEENIYTIDSVTITDAYEGDGFFSFITVTSADWNVVNSGDRYGAPATDTPATMDTPLAVTCYPANVNASSAASWKIAAGDYKMVVDLDNMTLTITKNEVVTPDPDPDPDPTPDPEPDPVVSVPDNLYIVGNTPDGTTLTGEWNPAATIAFTKDGNIFTLDKVTIVDAYEGYGWFSFVTVEGSDWDAVNSGDRYGAATADALVAAGTPVEVVKYAEGENASSAASWKIAAGTYKMVVDFDNMTLTATASAPTAINTIDAEQAEAEYFDFSGNRVVSPAAGTFVIVRRGNVITKQVVR